MKFTNKRYKRCFYYSKLVKNYLNDNNRNNSMCLNNNQNLKEKSFKSNNQNFLYSIAKKSLLQRIEI